MKLKYDDIKLGGKVKMPGSINHIGEITGIDNTSLLEGINEPIFTVKFDEFRAAYGLKLIIKNYIQQSA